MDTRKSWFLIVISMALISCSEIGTDSPIGSSKSGAIAFNLAKSTIPSEVGILEVSLKREGYDSITETVFINNFMDTVRIAIDGIPVGTWQLMLNAKDSSGFLQYTGSAEVTILENQTVLAFVHMSRVGTGTGSIEINVVWQKNPKLNEEFNLAYGQSVTIQNTNLRIKFKEVPEDSRCPINATCVWAGNARVVLEVNGTLLEVNTDLTPRSVVHGNYKITLRSLLPYPNMDSLILSLYTAVLYVSNVDDIIMVDEVDSSLINTVPAIINDSITVSNYMIRMNVSYGGGCSEHTFALYGSKVFLLSNPPQVAIYLSHNASDSCEAWISSELQFSLLPLITECKKQFGSGKILLRIYPPGSTEPVQPLVPLSF